MILARKIIKIPEVRMIFAPKMPEFYIIIARKKYFSPTSMPGSSKHHVSSILPELRLC